MHRTINLVPAAHCRRWPARSRSTPSSTIRAGWRCACAALERTHREGWKRTSQCSRPSMRTWRGPSGSSPWPARSAWRPSAPASTCASTRRGAGRGGGPAPSAAAAVSGDGACSLTAAARSNANGCRRTRRRQRDGGLPAACALALALAVLLLCFAAVAASSCALRSKGAPRLRMASAEAPPSTWQPGSTWARPDIVDRHGRLMATDRAVNSLLPTRRSSSTSTRRSRSSAPCCPGSMPRELRKALADKGRRFVWVARGLSPGEAQAVHDLGLPGLGFRTELQARPIRWARSPATCWAP